MAGEENVWLSSNMNSDIFIGLQTSCQVEQVVRKPDTEYNHEIQVIYFGVFYIHIATIALCHSEVKGLPLVCNPEL